jgi:hypothetical protein
MEHTTLIRQNSVNELRQFNKSAFAEVLEEMEINSYDYDFRQRIKGWNKKYHQFLMLDLRAYMVRRFKGNEPQYKGNIYSIMWFSPVNFKKFPDYFHRPQEEYEILEGGKKGPIKTRMLRICEYDDEWIKYKHIPQIQEYYKNKTGNDNPTEKEYNDWGNSLVNPKGSQTWFPAMREHFRGCTSKKYEKFTHSRRIVVITFNYKKTPFAYESIFNYKHWDKITKKTSLKG